MQPNFPLALCAKRVFVFCITFSWNLHFDSSIYADSLNTAPKSIHTYIPPGLVGILNPTRSIRHMVVFLTRNVDSYWIVVNGIRRAEWMLQNVSFRWRMRIESEHRFTLDLCSVTFGSPSGHLRVSTVGYITLRGVLVGSPVLCVVLLGTNSAVGGTTVLIDNVELIRPLPHERSDSNQRAR